MTITEVVELLEKTMNQRLEELTKLGKAAKQLLSKKRLKPCEQECLLRLKIGMAQIIKELDPVKEMVFVENPNYRDMFAAFISFYDDYTLENQTRTSQKNVFQEDKSSKK